MGTQKKNTAQSCAGWQLAVQQEMNMGQWRKNLNSKSRKNARKKAERLAKESGLKSAHKIADDLIADPVSTTPDTSCTKA